MAAHVPHANQIYCRQLCYSNRQLVIGSQPQATAPTRAVIMPAPLLANATPWDTGASHEPDLEPTPNAPPEWLQADLLPTTECSQAVWCTYAINVCGTQVAVDGGSIPIIATYSRDIDRTGLIKSGCNSTRD